MDAQLSQTIETGQPTSSTKIVLHDGSFCTSHFFMQLQPMPSTLLMPTNAVQERAPEHATNSTANSCFSCGDVCGHVCGTFADPFVEPLLEGREPPLTPRRENQYLYFGRFLQEFGLVLRVGVRHSYYLCTPTPALGLGVVA